MLLLNFQKLYQRRLLCTSIVALSGLILVGAAAGKVFWYLIYHNSDKIFTEKNKKNFKNKKPFITLNV